mgnify:CR=1 FL=1
MAHQALAVLAGAPPDTPLLLLRPLLLAGALSWCSSCCSVTAPPSSSPWWWCVMLVISATSCVVMTAGAAWGHNSLYTPAPAGIRQGHNRLLVITGAILLHDHDQNHKGNWDPSLAANPIVCILKLRYPPTLTTKQQFSQQTNQTTPIPPINN